LDVRAQSLQVWRWQGNIVLPSQFQDRLQADITVQVTMEIDEREGGIDQGSL